MARTLRTLKAIDNDAAGNGGVIARNNLATAISNISAKVEQVAKNGYNKAFSYNYASAPDVVRSVKQLMHEYNIIITQNEIDCQMLTPEVLKCCYEFVIEHTISGETRTIRSSGMGHDTPL